MRPSSSHGFGMRPGSSQSMYRLPSYMRAPTGLSTARAPRPNMVPQDFLVRDLKEKRKFRLLSRKLTVFVTFVCVYIAVLLIDRNISGRSVVRHIIANELLDTSRAQSGITFNSIGSIAAFWDWFLNSFMEIVYTTTDANGFTRPNDELYTIASHTVIVGGFHLIQQRFAAVNTSAPSTKGERCYSTLAPVIGLMCFSTKSDSQASFGLSNGTSQSLDLLHSLSMFNYTTSNMTSSSGFQTLFLRSSTGGQEELDRANLMQSFRWIDRQTRQVEIVMPLYNRNLKLWSVVDLTIDFDLAGGVTPSSLIHVTNLEPYDLTNRRNVVRSILEGVFVLHVIYFFFLELWDICVLSNGSFRVYMARYGVINNLGDWGNIIVNTAICLWRFFCQHTTTRSRLLSIQSFEEYVPASKLALWDEILLAMNICNVLLLTARTLKYFQVTNGGRRLMYSVYGAMPEVLSFLPIYCAVIIGYTFAGHMLYGLNFPEWSTFPSALFRVFELNFGLYDPGAIYDAGGYLSAIFIYSSNVVFCILMLNVFMAIVMSTWEQLSEKEAEKAQERKEFSSQMSLTDMVYLILMKEDVVDALLDVALDLEGHEKISLAMFTKEWLATGIEVSPNTWDRIVHWYWDSKSPGGGSADSLSIDNKPLGSRIGSVLEMTDDAVKVIQSPRELSSGPDIVKSKPASSSVKPLWSKPGSAKVAADVNVSDEAKEESVLN